MPLYTDHEQVIKLKRELTCYDCDENLNVSDLTSLHYASPALTSQYLVLVFSFLTYSSLCLGSTLGTPFSSSLRAGIG